jgi:hypothetical protein
LFVGVIPPLSAASGFVAAGGGSGAIGAGGVIVFNCGSACGAGAFGMLC